MLTTSACCSWEWVAMSLYESLPRICFSSIVHTMPQNLGSVEKVCGRSVCHSWERTLSSCKPIQKSSLFFCKTIYLKSLFLNPISDVICVFCNLILVSLCHHYFRFFHAPLCIFCLFIVLLFTSSFLGLLTQKYPLPLYCWMIYLFIVHHYVWSIIYLTYINKWHVFIMVHHYRPRCNVFTAFSALSRALKVAVAINCRSPCDKISQAMYIYNIYIYIIDLFI